MVRFRLYVLLVLSVANYAIAGLPDLPEAVSNNATAKVQINNDTYLISFMGLSKGKTHKDVHNKVWSLKVGDNEWQSKKPVPSSLPLKGRLAAIAVGVGELAYVFGGYTVAEDHSEISSPDNFSFNVKDNSYKKIANMPVPVDDAIALVYQEQFIYLISGWHNDGNVNLVQVYDIKRDSWAQASPFLGKPVFGQAGGIVKNQMVICDGVAVTPFADKRRGFSMETACYSGKINPENHLKIDWRVIPHPTNKGRYRMASSGINGSDDGILFIGGSDNPYNYNGIGYNGAPSDPVAESWFYNVNTNTWHVKKLPASKSTMDHRGLIQLGSKVIIIGGMKKNQQSLQQIQVLPLDLLLE